MGASRVEVSLTGLAIFVGGLTPTAERWTFLIFSIGIWINQVLRANWSAALSSMPFRKRDNRGKSSANASSPYELSQGSSRLPWFLGLYGRIPEFGPGHLLKTGKCFI